MNSEYHLWVLSFMFLYIYSVKIVGIFKILKLLTLFKARPLYISQVSISNSVVHVRLSLLELTNYCKTLYEDYQEAQQISLSNFLKIKFRTLENHLLTLNAFPKDQVQCSSRMIIKTRLDLRIASTIKRCFSMIGLQFLICILSSLKVLLFLPI